MSPEQIRGETKKIQNQSDVYSMGVLYLTLTGRLPFVGETLMELTKRFPITNPSPTNRSQHPFAILMACKLGYPCSELHARIQRGIEALASEKPERKKQKEKKFCLLEAEIFIKEGKYSEAKDRLNEILSMDPMKPNVHFPLYKVYKEEKNEVKWKYHLWQIYLLPPSIT